MLPPGPLPARCSSLRLEEMATGQAKTQRLYWRDSYVRGGDARILTFHPDEKKSGYIVLDRTPFHPKGGGQPSDVGYMAADAFRCEVKKALLVTGVVIHAVKILQGEPKPDALVQAEVDWRWRYLLMRRHTAAHLLDHCVAAVTKRRVETTDSWLGVTPYVGYRGAPPNEAQLGAIQARENQIIGEGRAVEVREVSVADLPRLMPDAPNLHRLPAVETARVVTINGCSPIPCGGTHVHDVTEIRGIRVNRAEAVSDGFRIYFDVA